MKEDNSIEKFKLLENFVSELAGMSQQFKELKSSELTSRMTAKRYRQVCETLPQRVFVKDKDLNYILCNDLYARDLQIKPEEVSGKNDAALFSEEYALKSHAEETKAVETGKPGMGEETLWLGGEERIVQIMRIPLKDEDGQAAGVLGILWDITEPKRAEEESKKYRAHLEELVFARTSELERATTQFQGEMASRKRAEEEYHAAGEEWKQARAGLEEQLTDLGRIREQLQQESSSRRKTEEELQKVREEFGKTRSDLEVQLSARENELRGLQERHQREMEEQKRLADEYQAASAAGQKMRADLESQLGERIAELQRIVE